MLYTKLFLIFALFITWILFYFKILEIKNISLHRVAFRVPQYYGNNQYFNIFLQNRFRNEDYDIQSDVFILEIKKFLKENNNIDVENEIILIDSIDFIHSHKVITFREKTIF